MEEKDKQTQAIIRSLVRYVFDNFFKDEDDEHISGNELFYIFMTSSAFGSLVEALWCRFSNGFWERRTSVIYGDLSFAEAIGGVFLTEILHKDKEAPLEDVYVKSFFWGTVLEYVMSWGEETFTGYRSWDYSKRPLNINGRVCMTYSNFWGVLGIVWIKMIYPVMKAVYKKIPSRYYKPLFLSMAGFLTYDIVVSIIAKNRFTARREGVPAGNKFDEFIDRRFPDERVINHYPNSVRVNEDGSSEADTLNGTKAHAKEASPFKDTIQNLDNELAKHKDDFEDIEVSARAKANLAVQETASVVHESAEKVVRRVVGIIVSMTIPRLHDHPLTKRF